MKSIVESILSSTKTGYSTLLYKAIEYVLRDFTNYGEYEQFIMPIYIIGKGNCKNFKEYKTRLEEGNIIYGNDKKLNEYLEITFNFFNNCNIDWSPNYEILIIRLPMKYNSYLEQLQQIFKKYYKNNIKLV